MFEPETILRDVLISEAFGASFLVAVWSRERRLLPFEGMRLLVLPLLPCITKTFTQTHVAFYLRPWR